MKTLFKIVSILGIALALSAFRHTDVQGYTDPDYVGYKFTNVVLQMPNTNINFQKRVTDRLISKLQKSGIRVFLHNDLFPPTREWDEQRSAEIYERNNIDAGIVITMGRSGSKTTPGMVMFNTTTYGGTTTGYADQITFSSDHASFEIAIVDTKSMDTVWIGELDTRGAGMLFTGSKSTAKALVKGLLREWKSAGHLL